MGVSHAVLLGKDVRLASHPCNCLVSLPLGFTALLGESRFLPGNASRSLTCPRVPILVLPTSRRITPRSQLCDSGGCYLTSPSVRFLVCRASTTVASLRDGCEVYEKAGHRGTLNEEAAVRGRGSPSGVGRPGRHSPRLHSESLAFPGAGCGSLPIPQSPSCIQPQSQALVTNRLPRRDFKSLLCLLGSVTPETPEGKVLSVLLSFCVLSVLIILSL